MKKSFGFSGIIKYFIFSIFDKLIDSLLKYIQENYDRVEKIYFVGRVKTSIVIERTPFKSNLLTRYRTVELKLIALVYNMN